mgnify:CR=1 FL=1
MRRTPPPPSAQRFAPALRSLAPPVRVAVADSKRTPSVSTRRSLAVPSAIPASDADTRAPQLSCTPTASTPTAAARSRTERAEAVALQDAGCAVAGGAGCAFTTALALTPRLLSAAPAVANQGETLALGGLALSLTPEHNAVTVGGAAWRRLGGASRR